MISSTFQHGQLMVDVLFFVIENNIFFRKSNLNYIVCSLFQSRSYTKPLVNKQTLWRI